MRVEPASKRLGGKESIPLKVRVERIARMVAIVVAFLSTFGFFVKILFF
jgi:hypothetical protein